jgi:NADPH-dependent ferric siderophore reductase
MNRPRPNRRPRITRNTTVVDTAQPTPNMVRIIVEGPALDGFVVGEFTDHYVKCRFGESTRTYTVRERKPALARTAGPFFWIEDRPPAAAYDQVVGTSDVALLVAGWRGGRRPRSRLGGSRHSRR